MSQNIFDLKKKRGRKRKLQNSGDCSLSRSGSCDEPLQFDEKIENLNQDQETIETTLAMMIKTQEITTLTAHHEIIQEESPMHICKPSLEKRQKTIENHQKTIDNHQKTIENHHKTIENHQKTIENHFVETEAISSDKENRLNSTNNQGNSSLKSPIKIDHETSKVLNNNDKKDFENNEEITIDSDSSDDFHLSIDDEEDSDFESENISNFGKDFQKFTFFSPNFPQKSTFKITVQSVRKSRSMNKAK